MKIRKNDKLQDTCDICTRIVCKQCGWVASDEEAASIRIGVLVMCPVCGWKPQ